MKKIYQIIFVTALISISLFKANAQEPRVYSQFFMNPFIYNPSYAGVEGHSVIFLMYRQQWSAISGGPTIGHVSFHTPLKNGIGVGGSIFNESQGIIENVGIKGAASYLVNIDKTHYIRFGMSLGVGTSSLNFDQLDDPTDPAFTNLVSDKLYTIGEFGMTYHTGHFNVGLALPSLFSYDVVSETDFSAINVKPLDRALIKANYRGHITDDFAFEPHIIYRYSKNTLNQFEAAAIFHLKHVIWTGMSYRQNAGLIALFGTKVKESLGIGYAFELGKPGITNLTGNTHEIHIGYHIGSKKRHADHVSSFIKSHRLTSEERAAKAEQARLDMLETLAEVEKEEEKPEVVEVDDKKLPAQNTDIQEERLPAITDTRILFVDEKTGVEKFIEKKSIKEVWIYQKPISSQQVTRINSEGNVETAVVMTRETADGQKETIVDFIPVPEVGSKETWAIANPNETPIERVNQKGEREVGLEWQKTDAQGNITNEMSWSKVYTGDTNSEEIINQIEGINIPDNSRVPVLNVQENLRPDEKVEELRIEFDNTAEGKNVKPSSNTITPKAQIVAKQETLDPSKNNVPTDADTKKPVVDNQTDPTKSPNVTDNKPAKSESTDVKKNVDPKTNQIPTDTDKIDSYQRGTHMLELPAGHHIIAGAFENFQNAEDESDRIFGRGFTDVKVGYVSAKKLYFVVINTFDDVNKATSERNRIRRNTNFQKIWVLTVEN
jgi:type IX secretion system PorP/SprF family membrane protein